MSSSRNLHGTSWATATSQIVDGVVEGSIVSLELLKSVADTISVPYLGLSSQILLSILTAVSRSRENTELLAELAERAVQVVATIEAQLKDLTPSPRIQANVTTLEEVLRSIEECVKREGQRRLFYKLVLSQKVRVRVAALEQKLQNALSMFQVKTLLSVHDISETLIDSTKKQSSTLQRIEAKISDIYEVTEAGTNGRPGPNIKVVRYEDVDPLEELYLDSNYQIQSANVDNRMVVTKVFHGSRAKQHWKTTVEFSRRMIHPNLLHMKGVSSVESPTPFIVFGSSCEGSVESRIASALVEDLNRSTRLGLRIVSGLSSGLNFLNMQGVPLASINLDNFEIFVTVEDSVVIGINPVSLTGICSEDNSDPVQDDNSKDEALWRIFNDLCLKTFEDANHILYQEQLDRDKALPEEPGIEQLSHQQQAGSETRVEPSGTSIRGRSSLGKEEKPNVRPRRELVWMPPPQRGSATLALVAQHYKKMLMIPRHGETTILRQLSARRAPRIRHRCEGYRKEEITLTTTIQQSAIVSHLTPSPRERCTVCGQVVEDAGFFRCVCGATEDDGVSPTIKCHICSTWQHLTCVNVPPRGPLYFSCNVCTGVEPISPGSITYTTTVNSDGQVVYHLFQAVPASYQTPAGVVHGIQWVPAEATLIAPTGAQPASADFAEAWKGKSDGPAGFTPHVSETDKIGLLSPAHSEGSNLDSDSLDHSESEDLRSNSNILDKRRISRQTSWATWQPDAHASLPSLKEHEPVISTPFLKPKALFSYKANPNDTEELSFLKDEELEILENEETWWKARKADGSIGFVLPNYLQRNGLQLPAIIKAPFKAKALYSYNADPDDPNELSFTKDEELHILDASGRWWQAEKADKSIGIIPSNYLVPRKTWTNMDSFVRHC